MSVKGDNCSRCSSTHTRTKNAGVINLVLSILNMTVFITYLLLLVDVGTNSGVDGHAVFMVACIFVIIGVLASIFQFALCIMILKCDKSREPKWIRVYIFIGTLTLFFGHLSLMLGSFSIVTLIWTIMVAVVQIYFLFVICRDYKIIMAEKESETMGEAPAIAEKPGILFI